MSKLTLDAEYENRKNVVEAEYQERLDAVEIKFIQDMNDATNTYSSSKLALVSLSPDDITGIRMIATNATHRLAGRSQVLKQEHGESVKAVEQWRARELTSLVNWHTEQIAIAHLIDMKLGINAEKNKCKCPTRQKVEDFDRVATKHIVKERLSPLVKMSIRDSLGVHETRTKANLAQLIMDNEINSVSLYAVNQLINDLNKLLLDDVYSSIMFRVDNLIAE